MDKREVILDDIDELQTSFLFLNEDAFIKVYNAIYVAFIKGRLYEKLTAAQTARNQDLQSRGEGETREQPELVDEPERADADPVILVSFCPKCGARKGVLSNEAGQCKCGAVYRGTYGSVLWYL